MEENNQGQISSLEELLKYKTAVLESAKANYLSLRDKKFDRADVMKALSNMMRVLDVMDKFNDLLIQDMVVVDNRFQILEQQTFSVVQQLDTLVTALLDKNSITKEEIKDAWTNKVKPALEAKLKKSNEENAPTAPDTKDAELDIPDLEPEEDTIVSAEVQ